MSFNIQYDRDGTVIPQPEPVYEQPTAAELSAAAPEIEQEIVEQPSHEQIIPEKQPSPVVPQDSWKTLREKAERAERRAEELERMILEAQSKSSEPEEDLSVSVEDDSLVEGKHLSKVNKKIQRLEKQIEQYERQSKTNSAEWLLKTKYPDFDAVVTEENLHNLRSMYPEVAHTVNSSSDLYSKAVAAYTMIKKLGIAPQEDVYKQEKELAQRNAAKPKSLASISPQQGDSPLSKANAFANGSFTEEDKARYWKEMNQYRK